MGREKHQTQTPSGIRAQIRINGVLHRRHFKRGTDPLVIKQWLLTQEKKFRRPDARQTGHFDDDARAYLAAVTAMPSYADRAKHIEEWIAVFGSRFRGSISSHDIRAQLQKWRSEPRTVTAGKANPRELTLSASAVNHRRTALMHLFTVLDGKSAENPVRDVPKFREPAVVPRALSYVQIRRIFKAMSPCKSKARLMVIAYTGIPHAQLKRITVGDVDFRAKTVRVEGRKKGAGTQARVMPLTPDGVTAFKLMRKEDAWGPFSNDTLRRLFREACARAKVTADVTTYDLRHSFGTEIYRRSGDIRATQLLMGHSKEAQTHRYTGAAQEQRVATAIRKWRR
jgi:integrase